MSANPAIVDTDTLRALFKLERAGDLRRRLKKNGIAYFDGRDGPWTTLDALNKALGVAPPASNQGNYEASEIL